MDDQRDFFILNRTHEVFRMIVAQVDTGYAGIDRFHHAHNCADGVKQGHRADDPILFRVDIKEVVDEHISDDNAAMGVHGALGITRGSRGIHNGRRIFFIHVRHFKVLGIGIQ